MRRRVRSLQARLALRVATLYIIVTLVVIAALMSRAYDTARLLSDQDLVARAKDLVGYVSVGADGLARLDLPPNLAAVYDAAPGGDIFAIRDANGRLIAAMPPRFGDLVAGWPPAPAELVHFTTQLDANGYNGLDISVDSTAGRVSVAVARSNAKDVAVYALLKKFIHDTIWAVSFLVLAALAIGILGIRRGLKPVRDVSEMAAAIGPHTMSVRLPDKDLPSEIAPLVSAVNRALDRVEQGFTAQRQFTANAAHELRTPLAIITAALDETGRNGDLVELRADVARMNRLVNQLLSVARLDAVVLDVSEIVDLNEVASGRVAIMAPWALMQERRLAFKCPDAPVHVRGNRHAISDAIRNLVENAVIHTPSGTEVLVGVNPNGHVSVADRGPGIPPDDRDRIFDRFWRGPNAHVGGAGLGLAIVKEIMKAHGGTVFVEDSFEGGAVFTLQFVSASNSKQNARDMDRA
jgi:two-component system, OmpR family, sensor histidine kinase TctE